ncbi:MAG TPA: hypothetical protein DGD08_08690 [Gemmatimonas aurantiaca]|uniref:DUF5683 domain-containing protein n=2 Tax=Gemmatimonas aurantiaca TaxID=173480 RepID=C1A8P6_GEMAT|nr:hypothetical protein [Gemmatimonas aurantiaca]BAH38606.1 hypothetical protein GAU_1564 [Gemmatimonas aurantiaca T-27]HCT57272.1 hypothetical protein [Gemmatimonas aurantiaca]
MISVRQRVEGSVAFLRTLVAIMVAVVASPLWNTAQAQQRPDSVRASQPPATVGAPVPTPVIAPASGAQPPARNVPATTGLRSKAPLSSKRAFLYSVLLPGLGQSRLDRGSSGALFASVELAAMVMLRRTAADVREARRYLVDTLPDNFVVQVTGTDIKFNPQGEIPGPYTADLVRARRLHAEDWIALIAFNHLFSGADAFVSAQLWDMPVQLSATPTMQGPLVMVSFRF